MNNSSKQLSVGIIGVGSLGVRHAQNLHSQIPGTNVAAIMDTDHGRLEAVADDCGGAATFTDGHKLIDDPTVDAVVIASPDRTHAEFTRACLRANKPVFCEKPLAVTSEDALRIVEAEVNLKRRMVQVGFMRHYDPQHVAVKNALTADEVGRPILYKGVHRNREPQVTARSPGSSEDDFARTVIVNSAIHDLDSCRWFLEQEIESVFVQGVNTDPALGHDAFDLITIHLSLSNGCLGMIEVYVNAEYGYEVGVEIVGETGVVQTNPNEGRVLRSHRSIMQPVHQEWLDRFGDVYLNELRLWCDSLQNEGPTGPTAWDGYTSVLAAEACIRSLYSGSPEKLDSVRKPALYGPRSTTR